MSYIVFNAQGKQYKVSPGTILEIDKIEGEKGTALTFAEVLLHVDGATVNIGEPFIKGAQVNATIVDQVKGDKIRVSKFKAKARERRTTGFRAKLTKIQIGDMQMKKGEAK